MKQILLPLAVLLIVFSAFSIAGDPAKDILGKWKIDESCIGIAAKSVIAVTKNSNPDLAQQMEDNFPAIEDMMRELTYHFKEDNTYELTNTEGSQTGKWFFTENHSYFIRTREGRPDRKDSVLEISATRLRLISRERGDTILFVHP